MIAVQLAEQQLSAESVAKAQLLLRWSRSLPEHGLGLKEWLKSLQEDEK